MNADIRVENHGTIFLFRPLTQQARSFLAEIDGEDNQYFGDALVVEHEYAKDFAASLIKDGWKVV